MKNLLLLPLLLGLIPSTNAGVYYYPNYQKSGIKVKCADGKPNHIVELKEGKIVTLKGHGKRKYKNPKSLWRLLMEDGLMMKIICV